MIAAHNDQRKVQAHHKTKATINSLPMDVVIMIIEILRLKDAVELCDALQLSEHVAVQYCNYQEDDYYISSYIGLKPNSYKFLLKNKRYQIVANSYDKIRVAVSTLDLEFVKNYIEEVEPDLNEALYIAAEMAFIDAVKLLLSDSRVDPSAEDNYALILAAGEGHLEIVKLLLSDSRVDPSAGDDVPLINAASYGHTETVKLLLSDSRVDPSARNNRALIEAVKNGHFEIAKLIVDDPRVDQYGD